MVLIAENEIEFFNFLNDGFKSGVFKLKLKKLQTEKSVPEVSKFRVLVYKKRNDTGATVIYGKDRVNELGVYMKDANTLFTQNAKQFVSMRIKFSERGKLSKATVIHSPGTTKEVVLERENKTIEQVSTPDIKVPVAAAPKESVKEVLAEAKSKDSVPNPSEEVMADQSVEKELSKTNKMNKIQTLLTTDLASVKKVWAIQMSGEEIQVENKVFGEDNVLYLGNSKTKVKLETVQAIKFRGKVYQAD